MQNDLLWSVKKEDLGSMINYVVIKYAYIHINIYISIKSDKMYVCLIITGCVREITVYKFGNAEFGDGVLKWAVTSQLHSDSQLSST